MPTTGQLWPRLRTVAPPAGQIFPREPTVTLPPVEVDVTALSVPLIGWWRPEELPGLSDADPVTSWPGVGSGVMFPHAALYPGPNTYSIGMSGAYPEVTGFPALDVFPTEVTLTTSGAALQADPANARFVAEAINGHPGVRSTSGLSADLSTITAATGWTMFLVTSGIGATAGLRPTSGGYVRALQTSSADPAIPRRVETLTEWNTGPSFNGGVVRAVNVSSPWRAGAPYQFGGPSVAVAARCATDVLAWSLGSPAAELVFPSPPLDTALPGGELRIDTPPNVVVCELLLFAGTDRLTLLEIALVRDYLREKYAAVPPALVAAPPLAVEPPLPLSVNEFSQPVHGWWRPEGLERVGLADGDRIPVWPDSSGAGHDLLDESLTSPRYVASAVSGRPGMACQDGGMVSLAGATRVGYTAFLVLSGVGIRGDGGTASYLELTGGAGSTPLQAAVSALGIQQAVSTWLDGTGFATGPRRTVETVAPFEDVGMSILVLGRDASGAMVWPLRSAAPATATGYRSDGVVSAPFVLTKPLPFDAVTVLPASSAVLCELLLFTGTAMLTPAEIAVVRNYLLVKYHPGLYSALGGVTDDFRRSALDLRGTMTSTGSKIWTGDAECWVGQVPGVQASTAWTWGVLLDTYPTWQDLQDSFATWADVRAQQPYLAGGQRHARNHACSLESPVSSRR